MKTLRILAGLGLTALTLAGCGGRQRSSPTGGAANGTPRYTEMSAPSGDGAPAICPPSTVMTPGSIPSSGAPGSAQDVSQSGVPSTSRPMAALRIMRSPGSTSMSR